MDPRRLLRKLPWIGLPLLIGGVTIFFLRYETITIPPGAHTIESLPPGTNCFVDTWTEDHREGQHVVVTIGERAILSKIAAVEGQAVRLDHDPIDGVRAGDELGPIARSAIRGVVVAAFPPDESEAPGSDGR